MSKQQLIEESRNKYITFQSSDVKCDSQFNEPMVLLPLKAFESRLSLIYDKAHEEGYRDGTSNQIEHCSEENCPECQRGLLNNFLKEMLEFVKNSKILEVMVAGGTTVKEKMMYNKSLKKVEDFINQQIKE